MQYTLQIDYKSKRPSIEGRLNIVLLKYKA
jgi:hypothetical protein